MKKVVLILCLIILINILTNVFSNPIVSYFINEFTIDKTGWRLELHPINIFDDSLSLDNCYLTTKMDTAYFINGIYLKSDRYTIITQTELQSQLFIDFIDTLTIYFNENHFADRLYFGIPDFDIPPTPKKGQSICLGIYYNGLWQNYRHYLDNTPTIGIENDTLNAKGYIDGFIKDSLNNPIESVKIIYDYTESPPNIIQPVYVETNSSGYFSLYDFSIYKRLEFQKEGYNAPDTLLQIWPDSTITINIQMHSVVGITEITPSTISSFTLTQNFPNPFNSSTTFIYFLPGNEQVEINIYDEKGELIQKLFNGYQPKGEYKVNWNADNLASGIYFYELKTSSMKISKKCLLLK